MTNKLPPDRFRQEGWQGHFQRVERWHQRGMHALDPYNAVSEEDTIDFLYAFFQAAYHMRDWLKNSGGAPEAKHQALMTSNRSLKLCRDICNGSKHFALDPSRSKTARIALAREYVPPIGRQTEGGSRPSLMVFVNQEGEVEYQRIAELMTDCLAAWQSFCAELSLLSD